MNLNFIHNIRDDIYWASVILNAILDYELSSKDEIWTLILKLLRCLDDPKGIDGCYLFHKFCKGLDALMTLTLKITFEHFTHNSDYNSRLWIVIQKWNMSLNFEATEIPRWLKRNWRMLFVPKMFQLFGCLDDTKGNIMYTLLIA
jgi:hypothetical protein